MTVRLGRAVDVEEQLPRPIPAAHHASGDTRRPPTEHIRSATPAPRPGCASVASTDGVDAPRASPRSRASNAVRSGPPTHVGRRRPPARATRRTPTATPTPTASKLGDDTCRYRDPASHAVQRSQRRNETRHDRDGSPPHPSGGPSNPSVDHVRRIRRAQRRQPIRIRHRIGGRTRQRSSSVIGHQARTSHRHRAARATTSDSVMPTHAQRNRRACSSTRSAGYRIDRHDTRHRPSPPPTPRPRSERPRQRQRDPRLRTHTARRSASAPSDSTRASNSA